MTCSEQLPGMSIRVYLAQHKSLPSCVIITRLVQVSGRDNLCESIDRIRKERGAEKRVESYGTRCAAQIIHIYYVCTYIMLSEDHDT